MAKSVATEKNANLQSMSSRSLQYKAPLFAHFIITSAVIRRD